MPNEKTEIFVSYRRRDYNAVRRIVDRLRMHFGSRVYLDIEANTEAADYRKLIDKHLGDAKVMLLIISSEWNEEFNKKEPDWTLYEVTKALQLEKHIIPVLIDGATAPEERQLPPEIKDIAYRQASDVQMFGGFQDSMSRLVQRIAPYSQVAKYDQGCKYESLLLSLGIVLLLFGVSFLGNAYNSLRGPLPSANAFWATLTDLLVSYFFIGIGPLCIVWAQRIKCLRQAKQRREFFMEGIALLDPPKSRSAIWGLALAVASFGFWILTAIPGLFLSIASLRQISESNGRLQGDCIAISGIITSISAVCLVFYLGRPIWEKYKGYSLLDKAALVAQEGDFPAAEGLVSEAETHLGDNADVLFFTGQIEMSKGQFTKAYNSFKRSIDICKGIYDGLSQLPVDAETSMDALNSIREALALQAQCLQALGQDELANKIEAQLESVENLLSELEDRVERGRRELPGSPRPSVPTRLDLQLPDLHENSLEAPAA